MPHSLAYETTKYQIGTATINPGKKGNKPSRQPHKSLLPSHHHICDSGHDPQCFTIIVKPPSPTNIFLPGHKFLSRPIISIKRDSAPPYHGQSRSPSLPSMSGQDPPAPNRHNSPDGRCGKAPPTVRAGRTTYGSSRNSPGGIVAPQCRILPSQIRSAMTSAKPKFCPKEK